MRNESEAMQDEILKKSLGLTHGESIVIDKSNGHRLIVSYSDKRAAKDAYNREKGLKKLKRNIGSGRLTKQQVNQRGYNKFLKLIGEVTIEIDETKVERGGALVRPRWRSLPKQQVRPLPISRRLSAWAN